MQRRRFLVASASATLALAGCAAGGGGAPGAGADVVEVARANGLGRFARAVDEAGLAGTLAGTGPFTLFAPTDRAFAAMPRGSDSDLERLVAYHVVPGMLTSSFLEGFELNHTTATGTSLAVDGSDGIRVNGANLVTADLMASNGVVHVIDRVLTPR